MSEELGLVEGGELRLILFYLKFDIKKKKKTKLLMLLKTLNKISFCILFWCSI